MPIRQNIILLLIRILIIVEYILSEVTATTARWWSRPRTGPPAGPRTRENISIGKIIEQYGEEYFRQYEQELIKDYISTDSHVISIGGGAVNMKTKEMIKRYRYRVWLKCPIERLVDRYKPNKKTRPLLYNTTNIKRELETSLSERMPFYSECANIVINSYNSPPDDLADEVLLNINEKN